MLPVHGERRRGSTPRNPRYNENVRKLIRLAATSALVGLTLLLVVPAWATPDLRVYSSISWEGSGKPVVAPARFSVKYEAQDLTMMHVTWRGWGTRLATGWGFSSYNSEGAVSVTLYMGGGFTKCDNGKRYYRTLGAVGHITDYFPDEPDIISAMLGAHAKPRKALIWHLNCTGGLNATTGYWSRL